jgi:hypothetical protein
MRSKARPDWQAAKRRYLVTFCDGGSGLRYRDEPLEVGDELVDGPARYRVEQVEPPASANGLGRAWATLVDG